MWWHFIDQLFWGQTANLIQQFVLVNEVGGALYQVKKTLRRVEP